MKKIYLFINTLMAVIILVSCQGKKVESLSQGEEYIRFASDRDGREEYYLSKFDGNEVQRIKFQVDLNEILIGPPVWNSSLNRWFFSGGKIDGSDSDIYSARWDGGEVTNLTKTPERFENSPHVSPDGRFLAFIAFTNKADVIISKPDGSSEVNVTNDLMGNRANFQWLGDSKHIVFSSNHQGTPSIFRMTIDGKNIEDISQSKGLDDLYSISPDEKWIIFSSDRDGNMDLFALEMKTMQIKNLTNSPERENNPIWSPDGKYIAYTIVGNANSDIYVIDFSSGVSKKITNNHDFRTQEILWQPDSSRIIYVGGSDKNQTEIYACDLFGKIVNITNNKSNDYGIGIIKYE